jgi:hypothetical protein
MKKIALIALVPMLLEAILAAPLSAQDRRDAYAAIKDPTCINAIHQVHSDIENRLGGAVGEVTYYDPSQQSTDSPYEKSNARILSPVPQRQMQINLNLLTQNSRGRQASPKEDAKNSSIVSSPNLTKKYAIQIIGACSDVGSVRIWMWEWGVSWSVDGSGTVTRDRCVNYETWQRRPLVWGEMLCV